MADRVNPLTEGHRGSDVIKKGYQGGEVHVVSIERPTVSDPRGGTPAQVPSTTSQAATSQAATPTRHE
jgi:hypothetical protein